MTTGTRTDDPEPPPGNELAAFLWVLAVLLASIELLWWFADRIYSQ